MSRELEYELELEDELEGEWEDELEGELEDEWEDEGELEDEYEDELEAELEGEQFFGALASIAGKVLPAISQGLFESEDEFQQITPHQAGLLMEYAAQRAAESESEDEAEAFLGALVPLAMKALPMIASAAPGIIKSGMSLFKRAAPQVIRTASSVARHLAPQVKRAGRMMWRHPNTRRFIRTLPTTVRQTATQLLRQPGPGYRIPPNRAQAIWKRNMARNLASRRRRAALLRRHQMMLRQGGYGCGRYPRQQTNRRAAYLRRMQRGY